MSKFIALEGIEGCGKTTLALFICEELRKQGFDVVHTREPGGTPFAEELRNVFLTNGDISSRTRFLLTNTGRSDHMEKVILPAIKAGKIVVSERSIFSGYAYQVHGELDDDVFDDLISILGDDVIPFKTFYIQLSNHTSQERVRIRGNKKDVIENENDEFFNRVINGFECLLPRQYGRDIILINGEKTIEEVKKQVLSELMKFVDQL